MWNELKWKRQSDGSYQSVAGSIQKRIVRWGAMYGWDAMDGWDFKAADGIPLPNDYSGKLGDLKVDVQKTWIKYQRCLDPHRLLVDASAYFEDAAKTGYGDRTIPAKVSAAAIAHVIASGADLGPTLESALREWVFKLDMRRAEEF